jgi:hypothetical protein
MSSTMPRRATRATTACARAPAVAAHAAWVSRRVCPLEAGGRVVGPCEATDPGDTSVG